MAGTYELKPTSDNKFMFNLKAANGEIILTSQRYSSKQAAETGIASVRSNSPKDASYDRLTSADGKPYFTLKAENHQVIGTSELYSSESARDNGIESVKTNGPGATVSDLT